MNPILLALGRALPLTLFAALLLASQLIDVQGPMQAVAVGVGLCAAGYYGAWAAHFFDYPRKYGRKAVLAAAKSRSRRCPRGGRAAPAARRCYFVLTWSSLMPK